MTTELDVKHKGIVVMGGTFNPIHHGHLRTAVDILDRFAFNELRLIPCFQPVHKDALQVKPFERLHMVELACRADPRLKVDRREIERQGPSYTIDTLAELRQEVGQTTPIVLTVGMDSFLSLTTWKRWSELVQFAHILVVSRPGWEPELPSKLEDFYEKRRANDVTELQSAPSGKIWQTSLTPLAISSSMIRKLCAQQQSIAYLLPENVREFILDHQLYQKG